MFNLFRSQKKVMRIFLAVLLGLVGLSMVTYLIPTSGQDDTGVYTDTSVVAKVGGDDLTAQEVTKAVRNMTQSRQLPADLLSIYVPQIVQQMISDRALAYAAGRVGLRVSGDEIDNAILDSLPPELVKDGKVDTTTLNAVPAAAEHLHAGVEGGYGAAVADRSSAADSGAGRVCFAARNRNRISPQERQSKAGVCADSAGEVSGRSRTDRRGIEGLLRRA